MSLKKQVTKGEVPTERAQCSGSLVGNRIFVFGGTQLSQAFNDMYTLEIGTWEWKRLTNMQGNVPSPRWGHTSTVVGKKLYIFGGNTVGGKVNELHMFDTDTLTWSTPAVSGVIVDPRCNHTATLLSRNRIAVFGGVEDIQQSLVILNVSTGEWSIPQQIGDNFPEPRKSHVAVPNKNSLMIYGGWSTRMVEAFDDMWILNTDTFAWSKVAKKGPVPAPRGGAISHIFGDKLFVWGGIGKGNEWTDLHYMELEDNTWLKRKTQVVAPERYHHIGVVIKDQQILLFSGQQNDRTFLNDVYILDTSRVY